MRKLVVTHYENKILQATIHDGKVTDLNLSENDTVLGNIYVGKVANIVDNINACFIDYGDKLPCYYSLDDNDIIYADGKEHTKLRIGDMWSYRSARMPSRQRILSDPPSLPSGANIL